MKAFLLIALVLSPALSYAQNSSVHEVPNASPSGDMPNVPDNVDSATSKQIVTYLMSEIAKEQANYIQQKAAVDEAWKELRNMQLMKDGGWSVGVPLALTGVMGVLKTLGIKYFVNAKIGQLYVYGQMIGLSIGIVHFTNWQASEYKKFLDSKGLDLQKSQDRLKQLQNRLMRAQGFTG